MIEEAGGVSSSVNLSRMVEEGCWKSTKLLSVVCFLENIYTSSASRLQLSKRLISWNITLRVNVQPLTSVHSYRLLHHISVYILPFHPCLDRTHTWRPHQGMSQHTAPAVLSAVQPTQMRIGQRSPIWQSEGEYKTALHRETTVSSTCSCSRLWSIVLTTAPGKKLKRRLEDLERRAGSSSASPPSTHTELQTGHPETQQFQRFPNAQPKQQSPKILPSQQYTPPMEDNEMIFAQNFNNREGSRTPPLFAYSAYPAPEEVIYPPYSQPAYQSIVTTSEYTEFLQPVPVTLPSMMHFHEAIKRDDEHTMSPYNMYNQGLPSIDFINQRPYEDVSHPHVSRAHHSSNIRPVPNVYM